MVEQEKVNRVASRVLAERCDELPMNDPIPPDWGPGDVVLNMLTGDATRIRYVDRDRGVIVTEGWPLRG